MKFFMFSSAFILAVLGSSSTQCQQGKMPNKLGICFEPRYIQGCLEYEAFQSCRLCQSGYKLNKNLCEAIQLVQREPKINGCLKKSEDRIKCQNCANGFIRENGKCQHALKNCAKFAADKSCSQCKPNYTLVLDQCRFNLLLGCKKIKNDHTCSQCWQPFRLKDGHCQVINCQQVNDYGCVTCLCGFYLNKDRSCQKIEDGCLRYQRGHCINCLDHYRLKGGICQIEGCVKYQANKCVQCKKQYDMLHGSCQFKNCIDWSHDQCYSCKQGYKNQGGLCVKQAPFVCTD